MTSVVLDPDFPLSRDQVMAALRARNVHSRPFFYPLSCLPAYPGAEATYRARNPVAYDISSRGVNLPGALNLTEEQIDAVCQGIRKILTK